MPPRARQEQVAELKLTELRAPGPGRSVSRGSTVTMPIVVPSCSTTNSPGRR
ncbi:hypothetical protein [Luteimicrobium album]|uniref:hypothetical protein n=1 Tax=Luteimicrobium album TaxID=1054550 RepID=UPI0024E094EB|nr:hypothetical protein [Luteimicrobium album]